MTTTIKTAIDSKINSLGRKGCKNFLMETGYYVEVGGLFEKDYRRAVRSVLAAENWQDLNQLFLGWQAA